MKKLFLNRDKRAYALVDDKDFAALRQFHWMLGNHGYAYKQERQEGRVISSVLLHNYLLGKAPLGKQIDHINRKKLDNRRVNLRIVTVRENVLNRGLQKNNTSGYPGVRRQNSVKNPWQARAKILGKEIALGVFKTAEEAWGAKCRFMESRG